MTSSKNIFKIFLGIFLVFSVTALAQDVSLDNQRYRYIVIRSSSGVHAYSGNQELKSLMKSGYGAFEVRKGWQTTDKEAWAKYYGYPSYGIGISSGFLGDPETFGMPGAVFGFISFPLTDDRKRNIFSIEPSLGLTYNLMPYHAEKNAANDAIGAKMAVYASFRFGFNYKVNREIDFEYALEFTHFSNGRSFMPNKGLDMIGLQLGMKYNYNADQGKANADLYSNANLLPVRYLRSKKETNYKEENPHSINVYAALSSVQTDKTKGTKTRYFVFTGLAEYQYKINNAHGLTAGLDYFYDGSLKEEFPNNPNKTRHLAAHAGYDFMFYRFTILAHFGAYLQPNPTKPFYFLRPALRYDLGKRTYLQLGLKTNGFRADWVEFGVGFRPFRW
ncbi:MAG: acyloxyacyl hydrolase [Bacteroidota bacterium]|nr:acyloxyacyl hydrolase [Bacteroidota bacterium]